MAHRRAALDLEPDQFRTIEKIDLAAMRRLNVIRILDAVRSDGPISRASLAKRSGLSPPAVSALVDDLIAGRGLLREVGRDFGTTLEVLSGAGLGDQVVVNPPDSLEDGQKVLVDGRP